MATANLSAIQTKVRRLTRSPSSAQITDAQINEYINTFIAYDIPEELRLFNLHSQYNLTLNPYQPTYDLATLTTTNSLGETETLKNALINLNQPFYIDGYKAYFTQSRDEFFNVYPQNKNIVLMGTGNGTTQTFTKTIANGFLLPNQVVVTSIDTDNNGLYAIDDGSGVLAGTGITGTVNYVTGAITVNFSASPAAPAANKAVNAHIIQYTSAVLYYENTLTVRPVPDQPYTLNFEYAKEPTQLAAAGDLPNLKQWWQYIAYGAAKKIFEDRLDIESVQMILPEFKKQERLVLRRALVQQATQRTATIYSQQSGLGAAFSNFYNGF
jgi:hypothetical protein